MKRKAWIKQWAAGATEWSEEVVMIRPNGSRVVEASPCIWTRLHRGSSTAGRINVFLHSSKAEALEAGALFAVDVLGDSDEAVQLFRDHRFKKLLELYERTYVHHDAILRVEWGLPVGDLGGVDDTYRETPPRSDP